MLSRSFIFLTKKGLQTSVCSYNKYSSIYNVINVQQNENRLLINNSVALLNIRNYAKGKDKKKEKVKPKVEINETQIRELVNLDTMKQQMEKTIEIMKEDFAKQLSLRSTTGSIESLQVQLDGKEYTLQELAQIVRKNPKLLVINMSTFPQAIPATLKALEKSGMNLNPQQDGTTLYVPVPKVTKEHRENLAKNAKSLFVKCKGNIRDSQLKYIKNMKKKDGVSSDVIYNVQQQIGLIADNYIALAEKILDSKQSELLGKDM